MGSRGHIGIVHSTNDTPIYLYTHWDGHYVQNLLAEGLNKAKGAGRLSDESYATRIIFNTLTGCTGGTTSFGILIGEPQSDNEYPIPTVVWQKFGEPAVDYEGVRYFATDFIEKFLKIQIDAEMTG